MTTLTLLNMPFSLFQMEGESDTDFSHRVWSQSDAWCLKASDLDIPEKGPVRDVWNIFTSIREMDTETLKEEYSDVVLDLVDNRPLDHPEPRYVGTWLDLARTELDRREKMDLMDVDK